MTQHLLRGTHDFRTERIVYGDCAFLDGIPDFRSHSAVGVDDLVGLVNQVAADALSLCSLSLGGAGKIV